MKSFTSESVRVSIGSYAPLSAAELHNDVARLRMAQALARCEAAKCQAMIRAMGIVEQFTGNPKLTIRVLCERESNRLPTKTNTGNGAKKKGVHSFAR